MLRRSLTRNISNTFGAGALPHIANEPIRGYAPGSVDAKLLREAVDRMAKRSAPEIPVVIGGKRFVSPKAQQLRREVPSEHSRTLCTYSNASAAQLSDAVKAAAEAHKSWSRASFYDRAAVFLRASQLLTGKYRYEMLASTMLGQSKNVQQAEIDCIGELADFWRMGVKFAGQLYSEDQPMSPPGHSTWNVTEHRPLEGFVCAISPFNFTAIAGNLGATPALLGNTTVWKPSDASILSSYLVLEILEEAGLPPGVINFVPCAAQDIAQGPLAHRDLGCVAFTGSTETFDAIYKNVACNISRYKSYPRITGETGGKNFHLVHPSADAATVVATTVRSAFEYQGQKCSACSRMFVPKSRWTELRDGLLRETAKLKVGAPEDFSSFMCAVITEQSFNKISKYCTLAKEDKSCTVLAGGNPDKSKGWFVPPTIVETTSLDCPLLKEEIFGPVLTVHVYDDSKPGFWSEICRNIDQQAQYALTGAVYSLDRSALIEARNLLRYTAGNFYVNDKCTGAVVAQQPFGGSRRSGTNDKPGALQFLRNFVSNRSIKETLEPLTSIAYPHQQ